MRKNVKQINVTLTDAPPEEPGYYVLSYGSHLYPARLELVGREWRVSTIGNLTSFPWDSTHLRSIERLVFSW